MKRIVQGAALAASLLLTGGSSSAQRGEPEGAVSPLRLSASSATWGDRITARVTVQGVLSYRITLVPAVRVDEFRAHGWAGARQYEGRRPEGTHGPYSGEFVHEIAIEDLPIPGAGGFFDDPTRAYYEVNLHVRPAQGIERIVETERLFILRPYRTHPDASIAPEGPRTLYLGSKQLPVELGRQFGSFLELIRLGRRLPGGAVSLDHPAAETKSLPYPAGELDMSPDVQFAERDPAGFLHLSDRPVPSFLHDLDIWESLPRRPARSRPDHTVPYSQRGSRFAPTSPIRIGHYELRQVGRGGGLWHRFPVEITLPSLGGTLTLLPESATAYSFETPPTVELALPPDLDESVLDQLRVSVFRLGRGGTREVGGNQADFPVAILPVDAAGRRRLPIEDAWRPGTYEVLLLQSDGIEAYRLDRLTFEIGGSPPHWVVPVRPVGPELSLEDVVVATDEEAQVRGEAIQVSVEDVRGRPIGSTAEELVIATLFRKGHHTYGCAWRMGQYQGPSGVVLRGRTRLLAPLEPGTYEVRVFRSLAWEGDPERPIARPPPEGLAVAGFQFLGRSEIEVIAPSAPGAIALSASAIGTEDSLDLDVVLPTQPREPHRYQLEIWLAGDRFPGGVLRAPLTSVEDLGRQGSERPWLTSESTGERSFPALPVSGPTETFSLSPLGLPGDYEARLYDRTTGYHVDRATFRVRDPGPPPLPEPARYDSGALTDWPSADDPQRGIDAWIMPREACEEPAFPEPPEIRVVELFSSDPERAEDDEYRPLPQVQPGHPVFVEVEFAEAPPEESYLVRVDGKRRIRVFRTADPRLYRSEMVTLVPKEPEP